MNRQDRYDRVSIWLHWIVAALVVAQFATGWVWHVFERGSVPRMILFRAHIGMGTAILAFALMRIFWRLRHPAPPLPHGMGRATRVVARATHALLYLAILVQPVLGLLTITAFGKALGRWPRDLHLALVWVIFAIVALHVAAALWHQFVRRDGLLARMLPAGAAVLLLAGAAMQPGTARAEIVATDILGREVRLEGPAERISIDDGRYLVALSLIHPEPVGLLSAWPRDINRIGHAVYEQYRARFPQIEALARTSSSAGEFSIEQILAADPDLVILSLTAAPTPEQIARIEAAGVPVAVIDFFNQPLDNLEPSLRFLGAVTGREEQAEAFIAFRRERLDEIAAALAVSEDERPSVLLEPHAARTEECCPSPGRGNIGNYIELAGGRNIGAEVIGTLTGVLNLEFVIETDPQVYIATGGPHMEGTNGLLIGPGYDAARARETLENVVARTGISGLGAVREGRAHGLSHQLLNSPLDLLALEALAKWIRPDLFAGIDLDASVREINERFLAVPLEGVNWIDLD